MRALSKEQAEREVHDIECALAQVIVEEGSEQTGPNLVALVRLAAVIIASADDRDMFETALANTKQMLDDRARRSFGVGKVS